MKPWNCIQLFSKEKKVLLYSVILRELAALKPRPPKNNNDDDNNNNNYTNYLTEKLLMTCQNMKAPVIKGFCN